MKILNVIKQVSISILILILSFVAIINISNKDIEVKATETQNVELSIYRNNVAYSDKLNILYAVSYQNIDINTNEVQLLFFDSVQNEHIKGKESYVSYSEGTSTISGTKVLIYYSNGIAAKEMTEDIYAVAYVQIDGKDYYSEVNKFSVLEYAYKTLENTNTTELMANFMKAMLKYGSLAQQVLNYNTNRLADSTYYNINVVDGSLSDGFTQGRYQENEVITLTANTKEGYEFVNWTDSLGNIVSTDKDYSFTVTKSDTYTANYQEEGAVINKPVFYTTSDYAKANVINWGTEFDYKSGLSVIDEEDGDLTSSIQVLNEIDTQEYGTHTINYKVVDKDNNVTTFTRNVEVIWNYDVQFIGHAGSYYGAMNSEEAILYAITELKYQCVEIDLKSTKDGVFVLCHDDTFGGYSIADNNWDDLKNIEITSTRNVGYPFQNGEAPGDGKYTAKLCTLERYLEICKQYNVTAVIELKGSPGITNSSQTGMQALMDVIEEEGMLNNVIFLASAYNCLIWTRNNGYEYIPCQYLVSSIESETYLQRCIDYNLDISTNTTYGGSNSDEWIARYKEYDIKISTYTYTQYVDYSTVQEWIDKGVDYVTCDWHRMDKLDLPVSVEKTKYLVKFIDYDGTVLKQSLVNEGGTAVSPTIPTREGYVFAGWDGDVKDVQCNLTLQALYELANYTITYNSNTNAIVESSWATKEEFVSDFYGDLFNWISSKGTSISGLTISNGVYTLTRNSTTVTFASADDIKAIDIYDFEKTISNLLYKPVTRNSDGTCEIVEDNNYFLNSSQYRIKYKGMDQWLYNCIKTNYTAYDTTYTPTSAGKIQIFFRMQQWMQGTNIPAFNNYPKKYTVISNSTINPTLPTSPTSYTILDEITLPNATGNATFLGWYDNPECTGNAITKIEKGTTGNLVLYAKWE